MQSVQKPTLELFSHVDEVDEGTLVYLQRLGQRSLPECLNHPGPGSKQLADLEEVEITVITDAAIAEVHDQFLNDPTPTDVITFQHGEILISYDTAFLMAAEHGHSVREELLLYVIHGLLHLNGHLDYQTDQREKMHLIQNRIWSQLKNS